MNERTVAVSLKLDKNHNTRELKTKKQKMKRHAVRTVGDGSSAIAAFRDALNKPDFADVTFRVVSKSTSGGGAGGEHVGGGDSVAAATPAHYHTIHAHRAILAARSPIFREMFFGGYPEARQKEVVVDEFRFEHFLTVIEWAYCGVANMSARDVLGVLQAANYYGLDDLMAECRDLAQSFIDEENVLHLLEHASSLGESALVVQCLHFVKSHAHAVLRSPVWLSVSAECVERVLSLPAIDCEEALMFDQTMSWLDVNTTLREDLAVAQARSARASGKAAVVEAVKVEKRKKRLASGGMAAAAAPARAASSRAQSASDGNTGDTAAVAGDVNAADDDGQANESDRDEGEARAGGGGGGGGGDATDHDEHDADGGAHDDHDVHDDDHVDHQAGDEGEDDDDQQPLPPLDATAHNNNKSDAADAAAAGATAPATVYPSGPLVRRFFRLLRLSHLSVPHLLDRVRPLLAAHPCVRGAYVAALEFLVAPGHIAGATQVPRAPTALSTVQIDVPADFLRGWRLLVAIPQSAPTGLGFNQAQTIPSGFFADVPAHAAYLCAGEMVVGRDDAISVVAVGCVRIVRPIVGSRTPVVAEDGDICWHASQTTFGFTPKNGDAWGRVRPAYSTPSARAQAGVRFLVSLPAAGGGGAGAGTAQEEGPRHGKRFIYYK